MISEGCVRNFRLLGFRVWVSSKGLGFRVWGSSKDGGES